MPFGGAGPMHAAAIAEELGDRRDPLPARQRRALGARPDRLRAPPRHGAHRDAARRRARPPSGSPPRSARCARRSARGSSDATRRGHLRASLPRPGVRAAGPGGRATRTPASCAERSPPSTSAATATATPTPRSSWSTSAWRWSSPAPARARAPAGEGALERGSRRARFGGEWLEAEVLRGEPPAGHRGRGPVRVRAPEATLVLPPGWRAEVDEAGTIVAERSR